MQYVTWAGQDEDGIVLPADKRLPEQQRGAQHEGEGGQGRMARHPVADAAGFAPVLGRGLFDCGRRSLVCALIGRRAGEEN